MNSSIRARIVLVVWYATLVLAAPAGAQLPAESHSTVEIIAERSTTRPDRLSWVGLLFLLDQGWHIYWQNPGDSGEPPKVQWQLPMGLATGAIQWPQPIRLGAGTVVDYGYEGQVLLMVPITGEKTGSANSVSSVSADVKYIVCREMCIPVKKHLKLASPPGGDWGRWHDLFAQTRQQLPKPLPIGWKVSAESVKSRVIVVVQTAAPMQSASFIPFEPGQIDNSSPQEFASNRTGFRLTLKKSDQLITPISMLKGLIVLGPGRAYEIAAPVAQR
jgi:thiol:disulfide interchange protein DsbD